MHNPVSENTILIVEDENIVAKSIQNQLKRLGYATPIMVSSGEESIVKAQEIRPNLVLMDISLAGEMNGIQAAEQIHIRFDIPIVYLTTYADEETIQQAKPTEAFGYLIKPFSVRELHSIIEMALYKHRMERKLKESEAKYRQIVEETSDVVYTTDSKGNLTYVNRSARKLVGYSEEKLIGKHFTDLIAPDWKRQIKSFCMRQFLKRIHQTHLEFPIITRSGEKRWIEQTVTLLADGEKVIGFQGIARDITEDKVVDVLTGLPNRILFIDRLERLIEHSKRREDYTFAVLLLDIDGLKNLNSSLGHTAGDQLIIAMAQRLKGCLHFRDTVARVRGDEFAILLDDIKDAGNAVHVVNRIHKELKRPFNLAGYEVFITVSIGIIHSSLPCDRSEEFMRDVELAMYRAKARGNGFHEIFDPSMHTQAVARLQLETDLRRAIERHEFRLHYQPIVSLETNRITGFEALVRWEHPARGMIHPGEFIPVAEETGLIFPIGEWVLREACRQMRQWQTQFPDHPCLTISVNLSSKQFMQSDFVEQINQILQETELNARSLKLEITESVIMEMTESVSTMTAQLKAMNIQLQMDDFGIGYSSLSSLHHLPIDVLKIDKSFVSRMAEESSSKIVQTIVALAHSLGLDVTAEGIETAEQLEQLKGFACEMGQGYYFSKPLDVYAADALIAAKVNSQTGKPHIKCRWQIPVCA